MSAMKAKIDEFVRKWDSGSDGRMLLELTQLLRHAVVMERQAIADRMEEVRKAMKKAVKKRR